MEDVTVLFNKTTRIHSERIPIVSTKILHTERNELAASFLTKSVKFTLSIAVHTGGLTKNHFWLVATQKKRIGEQLNYFGNMCPKPFSWAKNERKLFSVGKSRGPLLARAALKCNEETEW